MACLSNTPVEKSELENEEGEEEASEKAYELPSKSFEIRRRFGTLGPAGPGIGNIEDSIQKQLSLEGSETGEVPEKNSEGIKDLLDDESREKPRVATDGNY